MRLSGLELLACWEALGLGVPPALLPSLSPAQSPREHQRWCCAALDRLAGRGLTEDAHPVPSLARALRLLAGPERLLDLRLSDRPRRTLLGLGAVAATEGLMVVCHGGHEGPFELFSMDAAHVAGSLLGLCGSITPGVGRPVNVPAELLDDAHTNARGDLWRMAERLEHAGVPRPDAAALVHMVTGIRAGGQLGVTTADRRAPWVIGFHATDAGWFLQLRRPDHTGAGSGHTVTVCPTDAARLHRHWNDLIHAAQHSPRTPR